MYPGSSETLSENDHDLMAARGVRDHIAVDRLAVDCHCSDALADS